MTTTPGTRPEPLPVHAGKRAIGAYDLGGDRVTFVPAVDVNGIVYASLATVAVTAAAVAVAAATRRRPAIGTITMGPGGWVSLKRSARPPLRAAPAADRPWWARALRARRLTVAG